MLRFKSFLLIIVACFLSILLVSCTGFIPRTENIPGLPITRTTPLSEPSMANDELLGWAKQATVTAYTYSYASYKQDLQQAKEYFTPSGWDSFYNALRKSGNLKTITAQKYSVSAQITGQAVIAQQGVINERYYWKIQLPVLISYRNSTQKFVQSAIVTLTIFRTPAHIGYRGLGITSLQTTLEVLDNYRKLLVVEPLMV